MDPREQSEKADVVRFLLKEEGRVMLCLDATQPGVELPRRFRGDEGLRLVLNSKMPQPIIFGHRAIESELRFGGVPHYCIVPYQVVWGAFNPNTGHGMFWEEEMPESIRHNYQRSFAMLAGAIDPTPVTAPVSLPNDGTSSAISSHLPNDDAPEVIEGLPRGDATAKPQKAAKGPTEVRDRPRPKLQIIDGGAEDDSDREEGGLGESDADRASRTSSRPRLHLVE